MKSKRKIKSILKITLAVSSVVLLNACSTHGKFVVPHGTELSIYERPAEPVPANGLVETKPFFWTAAGMPPVGGIPYALYKDGKITQKGKLRTKFRPVSIFWPPFALIYWPMGLNPNITYDLVNGKQE